MPCRYEYVTAQLDFNNPSSFNELGAEGWELVTCVPVDTLIVGVFKRHVEEPNPMAVAAERVMMPPIFPEVPPMMLPMPPAPPPYIPPENIQHFETGNGYATFYHYP